MNKFFLTSALLGAAIGAAQAQFTINSGDNTLEIGGRVASYYNYRVNKPDEISNKKNSFALRNLQINIEGQRGNKFEYRLQVDLATLAAGGVTVAAESPGLMQAYIAYVALPVKVKFGYSFVPFSQGSLGSVYESPFWSRGILVSGTLSSRRDLGLTLSSSLLKQRLNLYGGVYSGLGENLIAVGSSDASGQVEVIGRADMAWPARMRYREIDEVGVPVPMLRVGANARYTNKTQVVGTVLPTALIDPNNLRFIDGKRSVYGLDAMFAYRHFTAQAEYQRLVATPSQAGDILFNNATADASGGKVNAGGYVATVNYDFLKVKSVLSVRYEDVNLNDLVYGKQQWLYVGYAYTMNGFRNVIKVQYSRPVTEDVAQNPLKYTDQIRAGWQYTF